LGLRATRQARDGRLAFISSFEQIGVLDTAAERLVARIAVTPGCSPGRLALSLNGNELWAGDDADCRNIWIIDPRLGRITDTLSLVPDDYEGVAALAFVPATTDVVAITNGYTDYFIGDVFTLDVTTRQPRDRLPLTSSLITDAATSPDGHFIYVAIAYYPSRLAIIDTVSHTFIDTVGLPSYVRALAVSRNGSRVYAVSSTDTVNWTQSDTVVSVVDTSSRAVRRLASLSGRAGRVALTHDDESLLVPLADSEGSVARIDVTTGEVMGSTPAGKEPVAIALGVTPGATGTSGCGIARHPRSGAIWILPFLALVLIRGRFLSACGRSKLTLRCCGPHHQRQRHSYPAR
jgi:DNA-binding beta-propeller fold protein YncE